MKKCPDRSGSNNNNWRGGTYINTQGYIMILRDNHGYVLEHRLIWEEYNKATLLDYTDIHHINGNKQDNRIENLEVLIHGKHSRLTHTKNMSDRKCFKCQSNKTIIENGWSHWRKYPLDKSVWLCHKCYQFFRKNKRLC